MQKLSVYLTICSIVIALHVSGQQSDQTVVTASGGGSHVVTSSVRTSAKMDSLPLMTYEDSVNVGDIAVKTMDKGSVSSFLSLFKKGNIEEKKKLFSHRAYYNLAVLMARYKNYPLALKYFGLANAFSDPTLADHKFKLDVDSSLLDFPMPLFDKDSLIEHPEKYVVGSDTVLLTNRDKKIDSKPVSFRKLLAPFKDDEDGLAYGIILHLKQPEYGKRKQFALFNNVGHMFISLIKYEADGKSVSRTFGFYPQKDNPLSATPIFPGTSSTFKNDSLHLWDESVGKFITYKQFKLVLRMVRQYSKKRYHLNKNNCTDFGLVVAGVAGINIQETNGTWPLGRGNDPGDTGQSILEGKISDMESHDNSKLFIVTGN
ncbi:MAG: hypothetical protein DI598_00115 [Pseudopedobacter saltans]|uniref:Uncharacterized protein n=1 Tax=Pseudopedobacter saltans TaxID=151895 RepID=A0A2W5HB04_9SPHI|nr:MAG: hypothetical protein DI598_00115 [Pseudopedobacter saltans]